METFVHTIDKFTGWVGKAFAWAILIMTFGVAYEVFVRKVFNMPTAWAFDVSYMMYGALFMMAGAYALSRNAHVRGDFIYRLWKPRTQAMVEFVLYFIFFFPGVIALIFAGWKYAARSYGYQEVSVMSPAGVPIFQFKAIIVAAGILLFLQGCAQVVRCILCIRTGEWLQSEEDVEEMEEVLLRQAKAEKGELTDQDSAVLRSAMKDDAETAADPEDETARTPSTETIADKDTKE